MNQEDTQTFQNDAYNNSEMRNGRVGGVRIMLRDIKTVIQSFILLLNALAGSIGFLFFHFFAALLFLHTVTAFFPFLAATIELVVIPTLEVLVELFNIFAMIAIIVLGFLTKKVEYI